MTIDLLFSKGVAKARKKYITQHSKSEFNFLKDLILKVYTEKNANFFFNMEFAILGNYKKETVVHVLSDLGYVYGKDYTVSFPSIPRRVDLKFF